jgi:SPX domain protein involved in polyphosphate accumulation
MVKVEITKSNRNDKRFQAVFTDDKTGKKIKTTQFGLKNPKIGTFIDHKDKKIKENYLKRHKKNENWNDFESAGSLSRYILWNKPTFQESLNDYKRIFKLK